MSSCLVQGNCPRISSVSDKNNWKAVMKALSVIGFKEEEVQVIINTKEKNPHILSFFDAVFGISNCCLQIIAIANNLHKICKYSAVCPRTC